jgi:hypothetical protein
MSLLDKIKGVFSKKESGTGYNSKSVATYKTGNDYKGAIAATPKPSYVASSDPKSYVNKTTETKDIDNSTGLEKVAEVEDTEKAPAAALAIVGILGGLYTLSPNLTGNAVSDMGLTTTNIFGVIILILGFVGLYLLFRKKKKVPQKQIVVSKKRAVSRKKKKRR